MKNFFTLTLCFLTLSITAQEPLTYPYNPDANSDTFVAVSDIIETLAVYGDQFFPEEIMVGDTTLSNWIQILNQTLANQQAVIDSLQASLASQETQLDSTMIADMIAAAGGLGSGGGCDLQFPDGYKNMEVVHIDLTSESYTVPDGKNLYITHANSFGGSSHLYLNNTLLILRYTDSDKGRMPTIISANNTISLNNFNGNLSTISGFLVDAVVESQHISLVDNSFTVPSGKRLYLRSYICDNTTATLEINGAQIFQYGNNGFIDNSSSPLVVASGEVISASYSSSPLNSTINGYLVDEDYFADCGGGGTAIGNSLSFGVRETIILDQLTWQALPGSGWRYYTEIYPQNDGFLSGELVGGCGAKETFIVQDDFVDFTDSSLTLQGIHIQSLQNSNPVAVKYGEKIVLTGNESAYTCSQDTLSQVQWLPLISNALGSDSSNNEGGSSEGSVSIPSGGSPGDMLIIDINGNPIWSNTYLSVGDPWAGGIIAHIFQPGTPGYIEGETHGFVVHPMHHSDFEQNQTPLGWGCDDVNTGINNSTFGEGYNNTQLIAAQCPIGNAGVFSNVNTCANFWNDLVYGGYDDWFMPNSSEALMLDPSVLPTAYFVLSEESMTNPLTQCVTADFYNGEGQLSWTGKSAGNLSIGIREF